MPTLNTGTMKSKPSDRKPRGNPVDLLQGVVKANSGAATDEVYEAFKEKLLEIENDALLDVVLLSWFGPAYSKLTAPKVDVQAHSRQIAQRRAEREAEKEAMKGKIRANMAKIVLMDMVLPHGKALKDSTGRECAELGPRVGVWLARVADQIRPTQKVGKALSEDRLQELYSA